MGTTDAYLSHAITPPNVEATQAPRPRLIHALNNHLDKRLILIAAAAGYGKTTLMAEFTAQADRPVCWVRLTEADRDFMRLAEVLWASLSRRFRRLRGMVRVEGLAGARPKAVARAIADAVCERIEEPFVVIFDDVHWLNAVAEGREFVAELIRVGPPAMTVVAAGRELLDVPLVQLLAADKLATFDSDSLALRADELTDVVARRTDEAVSESMVGELMEETGGWVTGVLLSERLVSHQVPSLIPADEPLAYEYLATAVFDRQPEDVQRFLLDSSALPIMTAEFCDAVLGRNESQSMLEDLLRRGIFLSMTEDEPKTYEYHHLFLAFLAARAERTDPIAYRHLLIRAAKELARFDEWKEMAVELSIAADEAMEAKAIALAASDLLFHKGRMDTLRRWCDYFFAKGISVPSLNILLASLLESFSHRTEATQILERASSQASERGDRDLLLLQRQLLSARGFIALANEDWESLQRYISQLKTILDQSPEGNGLRSLGRLEALFVADHVGDRRAAREIIKSITENVAPSSAPLDEGLAWNSRSYIEIYLGALSDSEISAVKASSIFESEGIEYGKHAALMNLAYVRHFLGKYELALEALDQAKKSAGVLGSTSAMDMVAVTELEMISELGLLSEAVRRIGTLKHRILRRDESKSWKKYAVALEANLLRRSGDLVGAADSVFQGWEMEGAETHSRLVAERLGILSRTAPDGLGEEVRKARLEVPLTEQDRTLAVFFLSRSYFTLGHRRRAIWWAKTAVLRAMRRGAGQVLAGELEADDDFRRFLELHLQGHDGWREMVARLDKMHAYRLWLGNRTSREYVASSGLQIKALGTVEVTLDESPITTLSPQELRLLAYLADKKISRTEALAELFWPTAEADKQMSSLHTAVHHLRSAIGSQLIAYSNGHYRVSQGVLEGYDVHQFSEGVRQANRLSPLQIEWSHVVRETLDLYGGPFLDGEDAAWVMARRAELETSYIDLAVMLADISNTKRSATLAVPLLRRALRMDPYREDLNRVYLNVLSLLGRSVARAQHFQRYRQLLRDDLGIEVSDLDGYTPPLAGS